jgi:hypothetical protein
MAISSSFPTHPIVTLFIRYYILCNNGTESKIDCLMFPEEALDRIFHFDFIDTSIPFLCKCKRNNDIEDHRSASKTHDRCGIEGNVS